MVRSNTDQSATQDSAPQGLPLVRETAKRSLASREGDAMRRRDSDDPGDVETLQTEEEYETVERETLDKDAEAVKADEHETGSVATSDEEEDIRYFTRWMRLNEIQVGKRFRKDPTRKLESLKRSIERRGLLHFIVVTEDGRLVAGYRRLEAIKALGKTKAIVHVVPDFGEGLLLAQRDENLEREDLTPLEAAALADAIELEIRAEAKERQRQGGKQKAREESHNLGRRQPTRDLVASTVGMSARSLKKVRAVRASGREDLIEEMDKSGKIQPAFEKLTDSKSDLISELDRKANVFRRATELDIKKVLEVVDFDEDEDRVRRLADTFEDIGRFAVILRSHLPSGGPARSRLR